MSPLARGVRTFGAAMVGVLGAAQTADWLGNPRASAIVLALGTITAVVAGVSAFLLASADLAAATPLGKSLATFSQFVGSGLATVAIADWTNAAAVQFGQSIVKILIAGVFAAAFTLAQNSSETT